VGIVMKYFAIAIQIITVAISLPVYFFDWLANRFLGTHKKTEYILEGKCHACGMCCYCIGVKLPFWMIRIRWIVRFLSWWHSLRLNFELIGQEENYLLYRCRYMSDEGGTCPIYWRRPRLCREYPHIKLYGHPYNFKECGFSFKRRGSRTFKETLDKMRK
jgi:Fe-S-cluster containining protein